MEQEKRRKNRKKEKHKIKALIFDLGGVIVFYDHMIAARKMAKVIGVSPKRIYKILSGNKKEFTISYELGKPKEVYWKVLAKSLGVEKIPYKKFDKIWCTIFLPNKKMFSLIIKIRKKYKIAIISNIGKLHKNYLTKKYHFDKLASIRVYSFETGFRKPHPQIFRIVLKKLKVKPEETIFIDDLKENIEGSKKLGINGIHFRNNVQILKELEKLHVSLR